PPPPSSTPLPYTTLFRSAEPMQWWCSATGVAWSWTWQAYPGVWLFIGLIAFAYARLVRRLRREGESVPTSRIAAFAGGTLTLWLDRKSTRLNSSHVKISY